MKFQSENYQMKGFIIFKKRFCLILYFTKKIYIYIMWDYQETKNTKNINRLKTLKSLKQT